MPAADEAPSGWWAEVTEASNVRAAATTQSPKLGLLSAGNRVKVLSEEQGEHVLGSSSWYRIDGGRYAGARIHSTLVSRLPAPPASAETAGAPPSGGSWITVHRGHSTLTLVEGGNPTFTTYVSLGNAAQETPNGRYGTYGKVRYNDMTSTSVPNPSHAYDIPNVPAVQYFRENGFAIHGTYWHDDFGLPHSEGCINMTITDAWFLFPRTQPTVPQGAAMQYVDPSQATPVYIVG